MIKRLKAVNFLSLQDLELNLNLSNVFVGPNMAGKSNIFECLKFLTSIAQFGVIKTLIDRNGFPEVLWKGMKSRSSISVSISGELNVTEGRYSYDYEIRVLGSPTGFVSVEDERLSVTLNGRSAVLADMRNGQGSVNRFDGTMISGTTGSPTSSILELTLPDWEGSLFKSYVASWRYYKLMPTVMKIPNAAVLQNYLQERGDNISGWLMTLLTKYPESAKRIREVACSSLPDLVDLLTPPTQFATTHLVTKERHLSESVNVWRMADGELVFLAFLSLILSPRELGAPLFCIEEPENHLHPRLLDALIEVLTEVRNELGKDAAQLLMTTHSTHVVDRVGLDALIVVEKQSGATQCVRPGSKSHLKELLSREDVGLGELWYSGALGGV